MTDETLNARQWLDLVRGAGLNAEITTFGKSVIIVGGIGKHKARYTVYTESWLVGPVRNPTLKKKGDIHKFIEWCLREKCESGGCDE